MRYLIATTPWRPARATTSPASGSRWSRPP